MQDGPVILREDVTVSLDKDLINELLGIAETRETTLSVLVREVLGSFCRAFHAGSDWTHQEGAPLPDTIDLAMVTAEKGGLEPISLLEQRITHHDSLLADLQRRMILLESGSAVPIHTPAFLSPSQAALQTTLSQASDKLSAVIDCDEPVAGSVFDEALVKIRKPVSPVMTSVDINSIGRINPQQVYSQTEAAALLNISTSTIRKYVKEGRIGSRKIGRSTVFHGQDLLNYLGQLR